MENNLLQKESTSQMKEPVEVADNSIQTEVNSTDNSKVYEGQSNDPSSLILGKFKSTDDLTEAYKQLEKLQGNQSAELGALRENLAKMNGANQGLNILNSIFENQNIIQAAAQKYPNYFSDPSFKQIYTEAYKAFGADLDVDRLVNLVESYASARIFAHEKSKTAKAETELAKNGMHFDKNDKTTSTPVKKSIQQMTPKEVDEMLERLI